MPAARRRPGSAGSNPIAAPPKPPPTGRQNPFLDPDDQPVLNPFAPRRADGPAFNPFAAAGDGAGREPVRAASAAAAGGRARTARGSSASSSAGWPSSGATPRSSSSTTWPSPTRSSARCRPIRARCACASSTRSLPDCAAAGRHHLHRDDRRGAWRGPRPAPGGGRLRRPRPDAASRRSRRTLRSAPDRTRRAAPRRRSGSAAGFRLAVDDERYPVVRRELV